MADNHIIVAGYAAGGYTKTRPAFQYDYGQELQLQGFPELPASFEMHFSIGMGQAITRIGTNGAVAVPNACLERFGTLTAWLFLHDAETDGETKYVIEIPVRSRAKTTDQEPTPAEQSVITETIAALNAGVTAAEAAQASAEAAAGSVGEAAAQAQEKAGEAAASATAAAGSAEAAVGSATSAAGAATSAGESASAAAGSATAASGSAEAAAGSATAAAGSAAAAAQTVAGIEEAGAAQVLAVNTAGAAKVDAINTAGTEKVNAVNTAGATQVAAVEAKGAEVIEKIPADYTQLSEDVSNVKSAINVLENAVEAVHEVPAGGTSGQILTKVSGSDYDVQWSPVGMPSDAQVDEAVSDWLDDHPEATTTVEDGSITKVKLNSSLAEEIEGKAPAIILTNEPKHLFYPSELVEYSNGYEIACDVSDYSNVVIAKSEDLLGESNTNNIPALITKTENQNVFVIDGEITGSNKYYYVRYSGSNTNTTPKKPIAAGESVKVLVIVNGTITSTETGNLARLEFNFNYSDGTSVENRVSFREQGIYTATFTASKEVATLKTTFFFYKNVAYDNVQICWSCIKDGSFETIDTTQTNALTYTKDEIGNDGFTVYPASGVVKYIADTKEYIDEQTPEGMITKEDLIYLSPEMYGAVGDGTTDDYSALQDCITDAIQNGVAVRGYGKYLTSQPVIAAGSRQNIYIHILTYTGSDVAFVLRGRFNSIRIDDIDAYDSTGAGFRLQTDENNPACYNKIDLGAVYAYGNGIEYVNNLGTDANNRKEMYYNVLHVQQLYSRHGNCILFHSTGAQGNENSFWGKHVNCANGWFLYCDADTSDTLRIYEFCLESSCSKGIYGTAILINCRTQECMDKKRPDNGDVGTIFKFRSTPSAKWYQTRIDYDCIDVSECKTFQERYEYMNQRYQGGTSQALAYDAAFSNGTNYILGDAQRLWDYYARNADGVCPAGKLIAYFNHKGFVPNNTWYHLISVSDYEPLVTDKYVPTQFDIGVSQATIHLNDSYCCVGINEFTLIQYADKKAIVYEKNNSTTPIFDGTNLDAGTYKFTCQMIPKALDYINQDGTVARTIYKDDIYFGDNEKWTVEKLNIVS